MNNTGKELKVEQNKLDSFMNQLRNIYSTQENIKNKMEKVNIRMKTMFVGQGEEKERSEEDREMPDNFEHALNLIETQQKDMFVILEDTSSLV